MVSLWPRRMKLRAARQVFLMAGDDLLHGAGYAAQVGAFNVGVDVDDRLHVVMADFALLGAGVDGGEIARTCTGLRSAGRGGRGSGRLRGRYAAQRRSAGRAG